MCMSAPKMPDPPPPPPPPPPAAERSAATADPIDPVSTDPKRKRKGTSSLTISRSTGLNVPGG